ncbi:hypothetical protein F511_09432 [Dorcoceras hygrometricum]|uniref:Uncharacterized protein n=1 Tax=Dorcoceras hygrometricum TaxID=472368 RepID=A0A2Z7CBL5_9LAMI|nr:hypothetical protein F511_09432 [Dorcoceras hygrometricum]
MASALYSNMVHIDFASVLDIEIPGIVSVLHALTAFGLKGFLGCPAVVYESELVEFVKNGLVRDDLVVSTVNGVPIEISEQLLADTFELPVDGLSELSEMPKDKIYDARSIVSLSGEPSIRVVVPDSSFDSRPHTVFALRFSQFCTVYIQYSLLSRLATTDITFLSSIALERTALRDEQRSFAHSVVPSVQFSFDQRQSSPPSADSSSSLHFDTTDLDATASSLPSVSIDFSAALADFQVIISEQINESQSGISSRLHKIEHGLRDSLHEQEEVFKNHFRKHAKKEVQEVKAKVDIMASRLNDVQKNVEDTKEAISHLLLEFQSQAQANQNVLHAQLSEIVNYINRGSAEKKEESSSRGPQQPPNVQIRDSGTSGGSAVRTPDFA